LEDAQGLDQEMVHVRRVLEVLEQVFAVDGGHTGVGEGQPFPQVEVEIGVRSQVDVHPPRKVFATATEVEPQRLVR
jgi:hypothetical protein